jgi:hypothetical protein
MAREKMYSKAEIEEARQKMLDHLASISGGEIILGCCTQGCCEKDAQSFSVSLVPSAAKDK